MELLGFLIFVVVALFVVGWVASAAAKEQVSIVTDLSRAEAEQLIVGTFSRLFWKRVPGSGEVNMQRRVLGNPGPVLSVDFELLPSGGTDIQVWMSEAATRYGLVIGAEFAWFQKRKILRLLDAERIPSSKL